MMDDAQSEMYQKAVDKLDVKYIDGKAYMNVHTIDVIETAVATAVEEVQSKLEEKGGSLPDEFIKGVMLCLTAWATLHDELCLREDVHKMPDFVPEDFLK